MGSSVRNGFSTLNRLLGKKNKDGALSKSSTNLSALDTTSQHNKIIPLAASNNAPFEQTFRITISLPRDQLFVVRVGAKTKLAQLLETVCANKQLEASKFEFRHPDGSQTYDLAMTIGEVGLNEIRLADKTDKAYIKFNTDDIMKLRHLSRESLTSSSDFSKSSARQYSKTVSPYSSTNSLNSMDSATGLNQRHNAHNNNMQHSHNHNHNGRLLAMSSPLQQQQQPFPPVAPQRKKRLAPRPPTATSSYRGSAADLSGSTITLNASIASATTDSSSSAAPTFKKPAAPLAMPRKALYASTPNLNGRIGAYNNNNSIGEDTKESLHLAADDVGSNHNNIGSRAPATGHADDVQLRNGHSSNGELNRVSTATLTPADCRQTIAGSTPHLSEFQQRSRTSSECSAEVRDGDVPMPRKRMFIAASKKKAPAPPPRLTIKAVTETTTTTIIEEVPSSTATVATPPTPVNQNTTTTITNNHNVSKVMLNVEPPNNQRNVIEIDSRDLPSLSPTSTPAPQSLESKATTATTASSNEPTGCSSSDEDETKIYNIQSGKPFISIVTSPPATPLPSPSIASPAIISHPVQAIVSSTSPSLCSSSPDSAKPTVNHKSLTMLGGSSEEPSSSISTSTPSTTTSATPTQPRAESPLWTYPLPAPLKFADSSNNHAGGTTTPTTTATSHPEFFPTLDDRSSSRLSSSDVSDAPIKPVIKERVPLDFQDAFSDRASTLNGDATAAAAASAEDEADRATCITSDAEDGYQGYSQKFSREALIESLERRRELFIEKEFQFLTHEDGGETASLSDDVDNRLDRQASVLEELKDVLQNDHVDALLTSNTNNPVNAEIAGCDPNALSNFSIQSYAPYARSEVANKDAENEDATTATINYTPSKRCSLTSNSGSRTPGRPINRSDSFHSTAAASPNAHNNNDDDSAAASVTNAPLNGLTPRSSSYISLIGTQKFETRSASFRSTQTLAQQQRPLDATAPAYRRSSSSELSIADAPSLQSLSVIKSILSNSRKSSLCSSADVQLVVEENAQQRASGLDGNAVAEPPEDAAKVQSTQSQTNTNVTITQLNGGDATQQAPESVVVEEPQKKWRYQGPPAINVSTWGERPKSTISIKTDNDYKFGAAVQMPQPQVTANILPPEKARKPSSSSNPARTETEIRGGITTTSDVAPAVVTIKTVDTKTTTTPNENNNNSNDHVPIIRGVVPKVVSTTFIGGTNSGPSSQATPSSTPAGSDTSAGNFNIRRPSYEISTFVADKSSANHSSNSTMTLGRVHISNRWSHQPQLHHAEASSASAAASPCAAVTVKTFKVADPVSTAALLTNYAIAKDGSFDSGYKSMPPVYSEFNAKLSAVQRSQEADAQQAAPFSQFTLRKTGLKDKILADSTARSINNGNLGPQTTTTTVHLRSADASSSGGGGSRPFSVPAFVVPQQQLPSKPINTSIAAAAARSSPAQTPSPPPPPVPNTAVLLRSTGSRKQLPSPDAEPRDLLLDAIRNFSKTGLKKK